MSASHIIVGDGIAGSSAAETIRETDPEADVTVITDEGEALYNRILIKEFAKGKLPEAPISIHEPDWYEERDIDLQLNTYVTGVDADAHEIHTHDGDSHEYDKLLVATGGTPAQLPVENSHADGIHHFWTFEDARAIREGAAEADGGIVVGAGLLGIDLAAVCAAQELDAHYLMRGNRWWRYALSLDGAEIIHDALEEKGVTPVFDSGVDHFEVDDEGHVETAVDPNGDRYAGEFCGVAIGLDFNTGWLEGTGVERDDGVVVDEHMQTSVEDIYAAGDITRYYDTLVGDYAQNGAWGSAKEQGAVAAANMVADAPEEGFRWVSSYSITHFEFPFLSFGHPTRGDDEAERRYGKQEWRRLALENGKLVGGVLIGDLSPQSAYKQIMREQRHVADQKEVLLEQSVEVEKLESPPRV
jgi:NAD(P)H-nitrite reductase